MYRDTTPAVGPLLQNIGVTSEGDANSAFSVLCLFAIAASGVSWIPRRLVTLGIVSYRRPN
jgi:hypothetical protein